MLPESGIARLKLAIESILFVADDPVEISTLARITESSAEEVAQAVEEIAEASRGRGFRIQRTGTAVQMGSAPEAAAYVERFLGVDEDSRLSGAALAALTVIAYRQPVTRPELERILGKNCDWGIATLRARGLIAEVGRSPSPGRPYLYGTTFRFLEHFGLGKPADLPPLPELAAAAMEAEGGAAGQSAPATGPATGDEETHAEAAP
jgi:segregation and condensation protein B